MSSHRIAIAVAITVYVVGMLACLAGAGGWL